VKERLQKILSRSGMGSRRACEEIIAAGRVRVDGVVAQLGTKADPAQEQITVDGHPIKAPEKFVYIALHKPRGVLSTTSSKDTRPTVLDLVDVPEQVYPVGRLDVDSEGLVLMTNDGDLTNRLTHPRYGHEKEYRVLVARHPDQKQLENWRRGVVLEDGYHTRPAEVRQESFFGKGAWLRVVMREGRKRQIRETGRSLGLPVAKIIRIRIGSLRLERLKPREWRHLESQEIEDLKSGQSAKTTKKSGKKDQKRRPKR
jgi:23S rRNA pseudouridine2605 synthase